MTILVLEIDGFDIVPYISFGGVKWQRSDVDGEGAGRTLDGKLRRNRVATKRRLDITCRPLNAAETSKVLTAIMPEWVSVRYSNNNPATFQMKQRNGDELWGGITFPLIEE